MILQKSNKLGVIFIDCWEQDWQWQNTGGHNPSFYLNMIETLSRYNIDSYVFHTSFLNLNYVTQDVITYFKEFVVEQPDDLLKKQGVVDLLDATGTERLCNELHNIAHNRRSIFIPTYNGFVQWCQTSGIENWLVVGAHWPICTHSKPLGFENLKKYKQQRPRLHFYSIPSCTAKWVLSESEQLATTLTDQDYQDDSNIKWKRVSSNLYELTL